MLLSKIGFSQIKGDTVDYSVMFSFDYDMQLRQIKEGNKSLPDVLATGTLFFWVTKDTNSVHDKHFDTQKGDTMVCLGWEIEKSDFIAQRGDCHVRAKISLNTRNNTLTAYKPTRDKNGNQVLLKRLYHVYSFTTWNVVLKDLSNKDLNRVYYFKRR